MNNKKEGPIEVFAGTIMEAEMVKSLLENAEIETFLLNENTGTIAPWYTAAGGSGAVKVVVSVIDYENAKIIVDDYEKNINRNI
ncbi:MAG: DUF2007 domain-containing protein [Bacteroidia bacterium]|nr:DUF2007 domain-containing protein [Bacteroidia bacterium]